MLVLDRVHCGKAPHLKNEEMRSRFGDGRFVRSNILLS